MGSPANLTLGPQVSTITSAVETTLNCAASPVAEAGQRADEIQKLAEYLRNLQEERGKIEAFKRELPLCMQLLNAAIETTKRRVTDDQCSPTASLQTSVVDAQDSDSERSKRTPVLENFLPLKRRWEKQSNDGEEHVADPVSEHKQQKVVLGRPAWMGEAQLWTKHSQRIEDSPSRGTRRHMDFGSIDGAKSSLTNSRLLLSSKHRQGGAFVPFNRERQLTSPPFSPPSAGGVPDAASLSLSTSGVPTASQNGHLNGDSDVGSLDVRVRDHASDARVCIDYPAQTRPAAVQPQRKARRCWSPELHRRFVSALQQLGGSQVATPKQIRELMKVDGLTNDEVKSHLQKYRLHTRRSSPSPSPSSHAPQLLILGWVPPECTPAVGAASQASTGGVCDDPPLAVQQEQTLPQSLRGASPVRGESPHSSSDSYLDESDDEQEGKSITSSQKESQSVEKDQQPLQSKGSTTCLPDIDTIRTQNRDRSSSIGKLPTFRKAKAAA